MNCFVRILSKGSRINTVNFKNGVKVQNSDSLWKKSPCYFSTISPEEEQAELIEVVSKGDKDVEHKLKIMMLEVELLRQEGELAPENHEMKSHHYEELLRLNSRTARKKYLEFLFKNCRTRENKLKKKEAKNIELEKWRTERPPKELPFEEFVQSYDLMHNNIFLRVRDSTINNMYHNKLCQAMRFGQKLIIDCGYNDKMTNLENSNCAKQLMMLFGDNRIHDDPFDLHFCNFQQDSTMGQSLMRKIPTLFEPEFPLNVHSESYGDLFPREKLVYLTPHCKEEMKEFDHDAMYIIGAIVDKVNQEPLSMAKAKQEKIRMMKFPLDRYLVWSDGSGKSLTLNQVVNILLDLKKTGDWEYSLRHVPRRKIAVLDDENNAARIKKKLLQQRGKWKPKNIDLNNLSFNGSDNKGRNNEHRKRKVSISSLFLD